MRKTFLKVSLLAVLGLGLSASFTSCKDYDDDIKNLQDQIDAIKEEVAKINSAISGGAVITGVSQGADGGVTFTLSNGQKYTIPAGQNGKDGKDADVWTIEKNAEGAYMWAKNGVITEYPAQGPAGATGVAVPGVYYIPNEETGCFDKVDPATGETTPTDIAWRPKNGGLTAIATGDKVVISGIKDAEGNDAEDITIWRSMFVKSLVVKPELYLDGIEATRYGVIDQQAVATVVANADIQVAAAEDATQGAVIAKGTPRSFKAATKDDGQAIYYYENEIATLPYAYNPSNAVLEGMKWNLLFDDIEVVNRSSSLGGEVLGTPVKDKDGNITITYQLYNTEFLAPYKKDPVYNYYENPDNWTMMALQVANMENDSALCASNNVFLAKEFVGLVHLAVNNNPGGAFNTWQQTFNTADLAIARGANNPVAAPNYPYFTSLLTTPATTLEVAYNQNYDLASHIKIETLSWTPMIDGENGKNNDQNEWYENAKAGLMTLAEAAKKFNLTPSFQLVNYTIKPNQTSEDQFAKINAETGVITPCYVTSDGKQVEIPGTESGRSAIGRKPIIYVTLTGADGNVVLAGFVKIEYKEAAKVLPGITLSQPSVPYICEYKISSTWEQITGAVYEQIGVTPTEFSQYYLPEKTGDVINVYELVGENTLAQNDAFKAIYGVYPLSSFNLGTFDWDKNENGTHTQALTFTITQNNYKSWYPTFASNGAHNGYNVDNTTRTKTVYAKFYNKTNNTTVFIGFEITLIGAPAADYTGKLVSQWSSDLSIAPINPAVPGQTTDVTPVQVSTGYTYAAAMSMNFTSVWNGGQPKLQNYNALYNFTDKNKPYLLRQIDAQYRFASKQENVTGKSNTKYVVGTLVNLMNGTTNLGANAQALYADALDKNGNRVKKPQPIAVITSSNQVVGIAARSEVLNPGSTNATAVGDPDLWKWEVISMLPFYNSSANSGAPYTPSYPNSIASNGWTYAQYACDIVNAQQFDKNSPAITFNVEMYVNYTQMTDGNKAAYTPQCVLVIPGKYDLQVGIGRPIALNNSTTGELQDAVNASVLASKLFSMVDWQGHLLWNTSRTGVVTANTFNGADLFDFWFSQGSYAVAQWPTSVINPATGNPVNDASLVVDLKNALVGNDADIANNLGKFTEVYVDKELTLVAGTGASSTGIINDNIATINKITDLDDVTVNWKNNGSAVTKNVYVFVPVYINYVWGQDILLGYATITVKPTLSEDE